MQPEIGRFKSIFKENNIQISLPPVKERLSEEELLVFIGGVHGVISSDDQFTDQSKAMW